MSENTLKRAAEAPHVIAAKNLAEIYARMGGKRSAFLEKHAKRQGFSSWNAYRAAARTEITLDYMVGNHENKLKPGVHTSTRRVFDHVAAAVVHAATKAGYSCDHSAPLVITKNMDLYVPLLNVGSLVLRRNLVPRSFCLMPQDLAGDDIVDLVTDQLPEFSGIIILDLPDITAAACAIAQRTWPAALIFTHKHAPQSRATFDPILDGQAAVNILDLPVIPRLRTPDGDMWAHRTLDMLRAFAISGVPFDPRRIPTVHDLDFSHPAMRRFVDRIPGFNVDIRLRPNGRYRQSCKAEEQYGFLVMNIFVCGGNDCAMDEFRPIPKPEPGGLFSVRLFRQRLSADEIRSVIAEAAECGASDIHVNANAGNISFRAGAMFAKGGVVVKAELSPADAHALIRDVFTHMTDVQGQVGNVHRVGLVLPESGLLPPHVAKLRVTHQNDLNNDLMIMRLLPFASAEA